MNDNGAIIVTENYSHIGGVYENRIYPYQLC